MKKLTPNKASETEGPACPTPTAPCRPAPTPDVAAPTSGDEPFISKHEVARRLNIGVRTVERWQQRGLIPYIKCGRFIYFNWSAIVAHLDSSSRVCRKQPRPQPLRIPVIGVAGDPTPKEEK